MLIGKRHEDGGDFDQGTLTGRRQIVSRWPIRIKRGPEVFQVVDSPKSHIESPGRNGGIVPIAFMFEDAEGGFADREIRRAEYDRANAGGLFHSLGCTADPFPLLLVSGCAKIFVVLQPSVGPSVRSQLVPAVMTVPDQMRIGFREAAGEEDRPLEMRSITEGQQHFESHVRAGHPIAVDRKVKLRGGAVLPCPFPLTGC